MRTARRPKTIAIALLAAAGLAASGSAGAETSVVDPGCGIESGVFTHGSRRGASVVALTFDACPTSRHPGFSDAIVDTLEKERVPATFFVSGAWAAAHAQDLARLESVPLFEIASHGDHHHRLIHASAEQIEAEMRDGKSALDRLGAPSKPLFRPPYGDRPAALGALARKEGMTPVTWDVAPGDPVAAESAEKIDRDVLRSVRNGSIVVLHVNGGGVHTAEALPALIADLRKRGFRFVTVSDLLRDCGGAEHAAGSANDAASATP